ncbi:MAG: suppressor of fused domain protein [Thermoguttaceae bacterium]
MKEDDLFDHQNAVGKNFQRAIGNEKNIEAILDHISRHINGPFSAFHELVSHLVHIDIHLVKPTDKFPFFLLVTSGMSDLPMPVPKELHEFRFAELCIALPPDWQLSEESLMDERYYWPIRWLEILARFPHEYDTYFLRSHTIGGSNDDMNYSQDVGFNGMVFVSPFELPDEFATLTQQDGSKIHFLQLLPLYPEEIQYKRKYGIEALLGEFAKHQLSLVVDVNRPNVGKRKKFFGIF